MNSNNCFLRLLELFDDGDAGKDNEQTDQLTGANLCLGGSEPASAVNDGAHSKHSENCGQRYQS